MSFWTRHQIFEKNSIILVAGILVVIAIGGLVEITPLFYLKSTIEKVDGVRPYTPLELAGRNVYVREGCYNCHSQMIRPLRDEVERYGHYSLAAESMYDRPFQWGSKRTGPDLARVGGKYSDDWHRDHLDSPKSVVPGTVMPAYPWLTRTELDVAPTAIRRGRPPAASRGLKMADDKHEIDSFTGTTTTGHVWDGIRELNTPLPRWWLWLFYITIIWSIGYWIVYPAWPLVSSF